MDICYGNDLEYLSTKEAWIQDELWANNMSEAYEAVKAGATFIGFDLPIEAEEKAILSSIVIKGSEMNFDFDNIAFQKLLYSMGNDKNLAKDATNISEKILTSFRYATNKSGNLNILSIVGEGNKFQNMGGDWHTDNANAYRAVMNLQGSGTIFCKLTSSADERTNEINNFVQSVYKIPRLKGDYEPQELAQHYKLCSESKGHKIFQVPVLSGAFFKMDTAIHATPIMNISETRMHFSVT